MKKYLLAVGIILLFIVVGFQPAFTVETIPNNNSNNIEKKEDCDCKEVSDINLNRLDKVTGIKDSLNRISTLVGIEEDNYTICNILLLLGNFYMLFWLRFLYVSVEIFSELERPILLLICSILLSRTEQKILQIWERGKTLDCWWIDDESFKLEGETGLNPQTILNNINKKN